jgi:hypothetical protein
MFFSFSEVENVQKIWVKKRQKQKKKKKEALQMIRVLNFPAKKPKKEALKFQWNFFCLHNNNK